MTNSKGVDTSTAPDQQQEEDKGQRDVIDIKTFQEIVGSLLYLSVHTRFDIPYAVWRLTQKMSEATKSSSDRQEITTTLEGATRPEDHIQERRIRSESILRRELRPT